jgi:hypothetical protein
MNIELTEPTIDFEPLDRLTKDLATATSTLSDREARFLVDLYYNLQDNRIRAAGQIRSMNQGTGEPHKTLDWFMSQSERLEEQAKKALHAYGKSHPVGRWMLGITGLGPVITAGLLAHISMEPWKCAMTFKEGEKHCNPSSPHGPACRTHRIETAGHIWIFAGIDPAVGKWEKGKKRPWNAKLKSLTWKLGESFVKTCNLNSSFYGPIYANRKKLEQERNEKGLFADQAKAVLDTKRIGKSTEAYKHYSAGKLPPAHIHARARRYAVKLFLSHLHEKLYYHAFKEAPPKPFMIAIKGHAHYIPPPESGIRTGIKQRE